MPNPILLTSAPNSHYASATPEYTINQKFRIYPIGPTILLCDARLCVHSPACVHMTEISLAPRHDKRKTTFSTRNSFSGQKRSSLVTDQLCHILDALTLINDQRLYSFIEHSHI